MFILARMSKQPQRLANATGKSFIFEVAAGQMYADGFEFFISENGVWLTDSVPVKYLHKFFDEANG